MKGLIQPRPPALHRRFQAKVKPPSRLPRPKMAMPPGSKISEDGGIVMRIGSKTWQSELDRAEDEKAIFKLQVEAELDALKVEHRRARREWTLICLTFAGLLVTGGAVLVTLQGIQTQLEAGLKQDQAARYGSISEAMLDVDKTFAQYPALSDCFNKPVPPIELKPGRQSTSRVAQLLSARLLPISVRSKPQYGPNPRRRAPRPGDGPRRKGMGVLGYLERNNSVGPAKLAVGLHDSGS